MSLITDAWKTAQREKQRREAAGGQAIAPVLVPLRGQPRSDFSWGRALAIGLSAFVIVGAVAVMAMRLRQPAPLPTLPLAPSPLAGSPLLTEPPVATPTATPAPRPYANVQPIAMDPLGRRSAGTPRPPRTSAIAARPAARAVAPPTLTTDSTRVARVQVAEVQQSGRLRIAVEQPRLGEAARLFSEALIAHRAGDLPAARALYERVLEIAPNDADALNNLGVLLSSRGDMERALQLLRRAASVAPNNAGTWNNIGAVLREQGKASDATAAFQHALTLDPELERAKVGLAQQYVTAGELPQARALLEQVLAKNPAQPEAQYALGQTLELSGDRPGAIRAFKAFIMVAPPRLAAHVGRVRQHVDSLEASSR